MDADGTLMEQPNSRSWILHEVDLAEDPGFFPLRLCVFA
jgi:hypothetical protein